MNALLLWGTTVTTCAIILLLVRILKGPTAFDRLLGFNGINTQAILLILIIGASVEQLHLFIDIAIGYAVLSLVGSVVAVKYLQYLDHSK